MADEAMIAGRAYWLKLATQSVSATIQQPKYEINANTLDHLAAKTLELNGIGVVELSPDKPILFAAYAHNHSLCGCILIAKPTNATVDAGILHFHLNRAQHLPSIATHISHHLTTISHHTSTPPLWSP